ncbi:hypothetical protein HYW75_02150 [Candidatus Pacearchaeota archaeon]|nr:hypothetical protein [Candidatus Pacearchaeota archaeon]
MRKEIIYYYCVLFFMIFSIIVVGALQFSDLNQGDFDNGTFSSTVYNGSSLVIANGNLNGNFTSRIFDSGSSSSWKNLSWNGFKPKNEYIFAVDAQGKIYSSNNSGISWTLRNSSYGRTTDTQGMFSDNNGNLYIIAQSNKEVWKSNNSGVSWIKVNETFSSNNLFVGTADSNNLYVIAGQSQGSVYRSSNNGTSWIEVNNSYNGGNGAAKGLNSLLLKTNISFQVRNCSSSCTDEPFIGQDGTSNSFFYNFSNNFNLTGRYFQYRAFFSSQETGLTAGINNVRIDYSLLDTSPPTINIINPENKTYSYSNIFLNYTVSDNIAIDKCWYVLDENPSVSLLGCSTASIIGLSDGSHQLSLYANDSAGNTNSSNTSFSIDSTSPSWSNIQSSSQETYSSSILSSFNISWNDSNSIESVWIESNLNYSMYLISGNKYGFNTSIGAGTFYWRSYANDSFGNINSSSTQIISVARSNSGVDIYINGSKNQNLTISYGTSINITSLGINGSSFLYKNNELIVGNIEINILGSGIYNYTAIILESENISGSSRTLFLNVTKASPTLNLVIDNSPTNKTIIYGTQVNVTGYNGNSGDGDISYILHKNYNIIGAGETISEVGIFGTGNYIYIYNVTEGQNYTSGTISRNLTINKASPLINLFVNGIENNQSQIYGNLSNVTSIVNDQTLNLILKRNNLVISNETGYVNDITILGVGLYNYTAIFSGNQNYSSINKSYLLNITKATPELNFFINGFDSDISVNAGATFSINASSISPLGALIQLYENNTLFGNSSIIFITKNYSSLGNRIWRVSIFGGQNYSSINKTHIISVIDQNSPQYSNLKSVPGSPATYSSARQYEFNVTWTDDISISEVIFQFNNVNYSYNKGNISKNNNEFYINLTKLASNSYSYRWWANDSSGNLVPTPIQNYTIDRAVAALFFTITPSWTETYGTNTRVSCSANNLESIIVLTRNNSNVVNPDDGILRSNSYNYACTSSQTQNYTSASVTGTLTINKATPNFNLTLNGIDGDINLPSSGGLVDINASMISPIFGFLNLTINGNSTNYSLSPLYLQRTFSITGIHTVTAYYGGNENYSDGIKSRIITVSSSSSGGGGSGGGGGSDIVSGGGGNINVSKKPYEENKIEFSKLDDVIIYPGEVKVLQLNVKNTGKTFLNKCKISGIGDYNGWIESSETKNINIGEIVDYLLRIQVPVNVTTNASVQLRLECIEKIADTSFNALIIPHGFFIDLKDMNLLSRDKLLVNYTIIGKTESRERVLFTITNEAGETLSQKEEIVDINNQEKKFSVILDVSKSGNELLKVAAKKTGTDINFVEEFFVYDSSQFVTGFALLDNINRPVFYITGIVIVFGVFAFFIIKRILRYRRWMGRR